MEIMREFLSRMGELGLARRPSQTAEEYGAALKAFLPGLDISRELSLFERARYGGQSLEEEELASLRVGLEAAARALRPRVGGGSAAARACRLRRPRG